MSSTTSESGLATTSETSSRHIEAAGHEWFPGIEVLRGFAATAVVIEHCWALAEGTGPTDSGFISYIVLGLGEWGVDLFFLLSGFLLAEFSGQGRANARLSNLMFVGSSGSHLRTTSVLQSCSCSLPNTRCSSVLSESSRSLPMQRLLSGCGRTHLPTSTSTAHCGR